MEAIEEFLSPVEGDSPAGPSLRYDPVYDEIKHAREEEDDSIPQGEWKREHKVADYPLVIRKATEVLKERSKDLQIAAWLTEAWTRQEGHEGLTRGLALLRRLMEEFWEGAHPEIDEDGDLEFRAVPLEWIGLYLAPSVESIPLTTAGLGFLHYRESRTVPTEDDAENDSAKAAQRSEALEAGRTSQEEFEEAVARSGKPFLRETVAGVAAARDALSELETFCDERFGDVSPNLIPLRELLEKIHHLAEVHLNRRLETDPDPVELDSDDEGSSGGAGEEGLAGGVGAGGQAGAGEAAGSPGAAQGIPAEIGSRKDADRIVAEAARFLRRENPADPSAYLMLRGLRWGELRAGGSNVNPRLLTAPPTRIRTRLKGLLLDAKWAELLDTCEEVMATPDGRGWLDLQRYTMSALEGLGSEYDVVARALTGALRGLLEDLPELPRLTLMDDSPTANAETREWLDSLVPQADGADGPVRQAVTPVPGDRELDRRVDALLASRPQEAIQLLMKRASTEKSSRARFLRRSQAAGIMVEHGLAPVALPILREMIGQVERHSLEEWEEGETVARPMALLYRCLENMGADESERQELYLRICRLDPMQAMSFGGERDAGGE
jgi:type VI secretion system protein ImpA